MYSGVLVVKAPSVYPCESVGEAAKMGAAALR
jgi:hypothetical protein